MIKSVTEEILNLSSRLMLTQDKSEVLRISARLNAIAADSIDNENSSTQNSTTGVLYFTEKEISKLPKTLKKEIIIDGCAVHMIKRPSGKRSICYELRYRRNGYNVTASSTNKDEAKRKFIEKLSVAMQTTKTQTITNHPVKDVAAEWLECRKNYIQPNTHKSYASLVRRFVNPKIGDMDVSTVRSIHILPAIEGLTDRTYEDLRSVLNQIFNYALANGLISVNPIKNIKFKRAERIHGESLSNEEIKIFIEQLDKPKFALYKSALLLELYFGLRPCEVKTIRVDGNFIVSRNAKQKKGKIRYKRIPIPEEAKNLDFKPLYTKTGGLNKAFKKIFPDRTQYDLRHTFSSICQQHVRREIVEVWIGDSPERLIGNTYTHFPDDFMLSEMKKVIFIK